MTAIEERPPTPDGRGDAVRSEEPGGVGDEGVDPAREAGDCLYPGLDEPPGPVGARLVLTLAL